MTPLQVYAMMVLCARDADAIWTALARPDGDPALPAAGAAGIAYLTQAHWTAVAQLRCDDLIICKGMNCYYGLLLQCTAAFGPFRAGDHLVALRGTMDVLEWINDGLAELPESAPGGVGQVAAGFWEVYASMTLRDMTAGAPGAAAPRSSAAAAVAARVKAAAGGAGRLFVTGHSLGAALAAYLTADLQIALRGSGVALEPYFFGSPRPGSPDYVTSYQAKVSAYSLVNYAGDAVPNFPTSPPFQSLGGGGPSHDVHVIPLRDPNAPPFNLPNNHSPVAYARMLDPENPVAWTLPVPG